MLPVIFGLSGTALTQEEREFFRGFPPFGFILFRRNIDTPEQVKRLVEDLRACVGRADAPVLIDQEGGRVQRLRPPHWADLPDARSLGDLLASDPEKGERALILQATTIAGMLKELGIDIVCAPVLDIPVEGADDVIGDRAYGVTAAHVTQAATITARTFLQHGITPVIKHIPGHGRASVDSHVSCPVVTASKEVLMKTDFLPFKDVSLAIGAEKIWSMTAHVVFSALDGAPVSVSEKAILAIRQELGFSGPIIPDAVEMNALQGDIAQRALASLAAGCDAVLHCSGNMSEMKKIADALPPMTEYALHRFGLADDARRVQSTSGVVTPDWRQSYAELSALVGNIRKADDYQAHEALTVA